MRIGTGQGGVGSTDPNQTSVTNNKSNVEGSGGSGVVEAGGGVNPWLASTPMVVFAIAFLEVVQTLMRNKREQGVLELKALNRTLDLAKVAVKYEIELAKLAKKNAMATAIGAGIAIGVSVLSLGVQFAAHGMKEKEPEEPIFVPDKGLTGAGAMNATQRSTAANDQMDEIDKDISTKSKNVDAKKVDEQEKEKLSIQAQQNHDRIRQENNAKRGIAFGSKDQENEDQALSDSNKAKYDAQLAKSKREDAEQELVSAERRKTIAKASPPPGCHLETDQEFRTRQHEVMRNNAKAQSLSSASMAIAQTGQGFSQVISQTVAAQTAMEQGRIQGDQAILDGMKSVTQNSLSQAVAAFNANSDWINAFLSALRDLSDMVQRAMSELSHG